ncbi:PREDICTED: transmembrane protein 44 [Nanorana parkeri]|uniref:transmembrane protein 44 n=1 Tax=Nanorana parkeri TaxID=125878 RepID=UPI000854585E|nr:PREDICTED: transmembrane protein 44 [Nanorana parkeri]
MDGARNLTGQEDRGTGLWNLEYLITCFADEKICVSFGLWLLSCLFWSTSFSLNFYLRCKRKSKHEESVFWNIYSFFGSMCNAIGSLLSKQLTIQVITGAYMALSDVINFILTLFPVCKSSYRVRTSHQPSRRKRQRKPVLSALSFCMLISLGYYSLHVNAPLLPEKSHGPQRKLLGTILQERVDVVGFTLGIIAVLVSWTVRVPVITKVCKGMVFPVIQVWAVLFSALASIMYAAAIMSHDRRPEYFVRAIPWFLISMGTAALDVALVFLSCMMKNKLFQQRGLVIDATLDVENCQLLAHMEKSEQGMDDLHIDKENSHWTPLNMLPNRSIKTSASLGRYVRLSIEQVQEDGVGTVRMPGDGQTNPVTVHNKEPLCYFDLAVYPPTHITHSSSSSSDRSSNTTDLEWDFEDLDQNWNKNSDVPSIQPMDSSVLNVTSFNSEWQFPSTVWPSYKNLEINDGKKKVRPADTTKTEQR